MNYLKPTLIILAAACIYVLFAVPSLHEPLMGDSYVLPMHGEYLHDGKIYVPDHPPAYTVLISGIISAVGKNYQWYRLLGITGFIASLLLMYLITNKIAGSPKAAGLACFLYAINPMAIKGSLITDIDTTILTPILLLFMYFLFRYYGAMTVKRITVLGIIFAGALLCKLTTPFILIASIVVAYAIEGNFKKGFYYAMVISLIGSLCFMLFWGFFSTHYNLSFTYPFLYIKNLFINLNAYNQHAASSSSMIIRVVTRLALLISAPLMLWYGIITAQTITKIKTSNGNFFYRYLFFYSAMILIGYIFVGRITHSFPKYHYPFVSALCILLSLAYYRYASSENTGIPKWFYLLLSLLAIASLYYGVGDLLYLTDYYVREKLITTNETMSTILRYVSIKLLLYLMVIPCAYFVVQLFKRGLPFVNRVAVTLFICGISMNMATDLLQLRANYFTVYCYGGEITKGFYDHFKDKNLRRENVLATGDVWYLLGIRQRTTHRAWENHAAFVETVTIQKPDYIIYGISSNTLGQYQNIFNNKDIVAFLAECYDRNEYGSFTVLSRRKKECLNN